MHEQNNISKDNTPLPSVVFCIEKEVGTDDGDADSNDAQDHQHQHHKSIHIVNLVGPERCENEVPEERHEVVFNLTEIPEIIDIYIYIQN